MHDNDPTPHPSPYSSFPAFINFLFNLWVIILHEFYVVFTVSLFVGNPVYEDVRYFPKGFFPSDNFLRVFFPVETSQMCNFPILS